MSRARTWARATIASGLVAAGCLAGAVGAAPRAAAAGGVTVSVGSVSVVEGDAKNRVVKFPVTLSAPATATVTVTYRVVPGDETAVGGAGSTDFAVRSGTVTFAASARTGFTTVQRNVAVTVIGDTVPEGDEQFAVILGLGSGPATLGTPVGTGTIVDDDPTSALRVDVGDASVAEGSFGTVRSAFVPVTLSAPAQATVTVSYELVPVTATAGADYANKATGSVSFPARTTTRFVPLKVRPDTTFESRETVDVHLTSASVPIGRSHGTAAIEDSQYLGNTAGPRVAAIGDSILFLARSEVISALTDRYQAWVTGIPGYSIGNALPELTNQLRSAPATVVVELGTDDVNGNNTAWRTSFDTLTGMLGAVPCVAWININDTIANYYASINSGHPVTIGTDINTAIAQQIASNPTRMRLVDWKHAVETEPGLTVDGIHPSDTGRLWLALQIRIATDSGCH